MHDFSRKHGLAPIADNHCTVLILGSMPSEKSLAQQEYYGHPRNSFWRIMQTVTGVDAIGPYKERIAGSQKTGVALWDVIASCQRQGSLDSNINNETINTLSEFIEQHSQLRWIGLNGSKAYQLFYRHLVKTKQLPATLAYSVLPSSSPAYTLPLDEKIQQWQKALRPYIKGLKF